MKTTKNKQVKFVLWEDFYKDVEAGCEEPTFPEIDQTPLEKLQTIEDVLGWMKANKLVEEDAEFRTTESFQD
ncbi:MAG TPA: hypothetical protein VHM20_06365 [Gammaproteobacteria bacterium]|nr:hypothetical protein [Gammaproteobacteria bacterium]